MANHTPLTGYPYGAKAPFPHGSANEASERIVKSPNFDEGSAHAPTGNIELSGAAGAGFEFSDLFLLSGSLKMPSGTSLTLDAGGAATIGVVKLIETYLAGRLEMLGDVGAPARFRLGVRSRKNERVSRIGNVDTTINATEKGPIIILAKPTAARTLTIEQATDTVKENDDALEIYMPIPPDDPASGYWIIKREGSANNIAILTGKYTPASGAGQCYPGFCRIHLEGGVWRLTGGAGVNWDTDA